MSATAPGQQRQEATCLQRCQVKIADAAKLLDGRGVGWLLLWQEPLLSSPHMLQVSMHRESFSNQLLCPELIVSELVRI